MKGFPELFSTTKNGKIKVWRVETSGDTITVFTGFVDGKITEHTTVVKQKNIGKLNETSLPEQAKLEAESKWKKKKDQGYSEKGEKSLIVLPMLAMDYTKRGKDIKFPCACQAKLDGVRAILKGNKLFSRTGKEFFGLDHITNFKTKCIIDGELYSDELSFQEIVSAIKNNKNIKIDKKKIKFIVYDTINDKEYLERSRLLEDIKHPYIKVLPYELCKDSKDVPKFHEKYVKAGYEGLILRNLNGKYMIKNRSKDLQKLKTFKDAEFKITGFTQGIGVERGCIIFECITKNGNSFSVRPAGTHEIRKKMFKKGSEYVGKMLTVKFFEYSDEGTPRFPTTLHGGTADVRDYE